MVTSRGCNPTIAIAEDDKDIGFLRRFLRLGMIERYHRECHGHGTRATQLAMVRE
jgi:hypothetical protein